MLSYAVGIVGEYVKSDLTAKLCEHLGLEKVKAIASTKRKSLAELESKSIKRMKTDDDVHSVDNKSVVSNVAKEKKVSVKEKQMAKAASGTKSISSFFTKK